MKNPVFKRDFLYLSFMIYSMSKSYLSLYFARMLSQSNLCDYSSKMTTEEIVQKNKLR